MTNSVHSQSFQQSAPNLSVLIPFYKDDASQLIVDLSQQRTDGSVEILIVDDGTGDTVLTQKIEDLIAGLATPARVITLSENAGRSAARNHLKNEARADWVLFLDADMLPMHDNFLQTYLDVIRTGEADVIFGGFTVEKKSEDKSGELHRALSAVSDCLPLSERISAGPQFVASSNLCLRKAVMTENPFDDGFKGWGWEDSEWAARISQAYTLIHIDNPALHLGLESTDTLLYRFKTSGPNYVRFTKKHPELAKSLTLYKLSTTLKKVPGQKLTRPFLKAIVKSPFPMRARLLALKLWRASWYAEALS